MSRSAIVALLVAVSFLPVQAQDIPMPQQPSTQGSGGNGQATGSGSNGNRPGIGQGSNNGNGAGNNSGNGAPAGSGGAGPSPAPAALSTQPPATPVTPAVPPFASSPTAPPVAVGGPATVGTPDSPVELTPEQTLDAVNQGLATPLAILLPEVKTRTGGEIIDARLLDFGQSRRYAIKVLAPDGRVTTEFYDAASGQYLGRQ